MGPVLVLAYPSWGRVARKQREASVPPGAGLTTRTVGGRREPAGPARSPSIPGAGTPRVCGLGGRRGRPRAAAKARAPGQEDARAGAEETSGPAAAGPGPGLATGHRRKNWKVRKFILREDPAYLHYYDPAAGGEDPLGAIHLRGCVVTSVESNPDARKSEEENLFEIITADEVHYFLQAATPKERTEWIKAIQVASRTGK